MLGAAVLVGRAFDVAWLESALPGMVSMKANTALAFVLIGVSFLLVAADPPPRHSGVVARLFAAGAGLIGLLTLAEYLLGADVGLDQLLFAEAPGAVGTSIPGRMAPSTALCFALIGSVQLLPETLIGSRARDAASLAIGSLSLFVLVGYLYGGEALHATPVFTRMAVPTAIGFLGVAVAGLCARPREGLLALFGGERSAAVIARRLLPAALIVPVGLGWLRLEGQRLGLYDTEFGLALHVLVIAATFAGFTLWAAATLNAMDHQRRVAEDAQRRAEIELRQLNSDLETRIQERTAALEAANHELEAFSYSVSHDLRAPLRAVDGFSRILVEDFGETLSAEVREYLQDIRAGTQQMGRLVDDLLAFSRLNRVGLSKGIVPPGPIVEQCVEALAHERDGRRVEIVIGELPDCEAEPSLLKQVWMNLLSNALKFTRKRELARIEVGCREEKGERTYFVRDNGVGFDMRYAGKLFGVFQRLHRAEDYEGTGVGLAIVERVVRRHGGRVWAEAAPDRGATFHFTLNERKEGRTHD